MAKVDLAKKMDIELRKVERQAVTEARRVTRRFVDKAVREFRSSGRVNVKTLREELKQPLLDAMTITSILGERRSNVLATRRKSLKLGLSDTLRSLRKSLDITKLNKVQKLFNTQALRILNDVTNRVERELRKVVFDENKKGSSVAKAAKALKKRFTTLGLTPSNDSQLENIFRTQSQIAFQAGRYRQSQDPETEGILWGHEYFTAGDEKVRLTHRKLDRVVLPKDHAFWKTFWPPNGFN